MSRRTVEIESLAEFDDRIARTGRLDGWFVSSLDLTGRADRLQQVDPRGAVFLGCRLTPDSAVDLRGRGALLFPTLPDLPFDPYRPDLYSAQSLLGHGGYADSPDARIYAWAKSPAASSIGGTLAGSLHDQAIANALEDRMTMAARQVVGVMGGHALRRDEPGYADAVVLGAELARAGRVVLTGGGPGAMEAANLGARLADRPDAVLDQAIAMLADAPGFQPSVDDWLAPAREVRRRWPAAVDGQHDPEVPLRSVGIPTWFYGHEPPNVFPDVIAKYFANPLREDTLLHRCRGGIVFLPGEAGTVSEIFTAATENYYAADPAEIAPLVLLGSEQWRRRLPAWPLLQSLGAGRAMQDAVHCVETVAQAASVLLNART